MKCKLAPAHPIGAWSAVVRGHVGHGLTVAEALLAATFSAMSRQPQRRASC